MSINLTAKEHKMLAVVLKEMPAMPVVDFEKVAEKVGITHARNARSAFKKIWEKLKACGDDGLADQAEDGTTTKPSPNKVRKTRKRSLPKKGDSSGDEIDQAVIKKKAKSVTKKAGDQRKVSKNNPAKANRAAGIDQEVKKETTSDNNGEVPDLSMAEAEDYFDQADDDCSEYKDPDETEDDPDLPVEDDGNIHEVNGNSNGDGVNVDAVHQNYENDETYAAILGLSLEQYRQFAREAEWGERNTGASAISPQTPLIHYSDADEV